MSARQRLGRGDRHREPALWPAGQRDRAAGASCSAHAERHRACRAPRLWLRYGLRDGLRRRRFAGAAVMRRIGIDVGGTNTDAVLIDGNRVLVAVKTATTADVLGGVRTALSKLLAETANGPGHIAAVVIGTTHFTNAVIERRALQRVGALRIGLPASASLPPL